MSGQSQSVQLLVEFKRALKNPYFFIAFIYFFCLLFGYYLLRPVREETGILAGVDNLQWLWSGTFVVMILITPLFGFLKDLLSRKALVVGVYLFFISNLMIFYYLFGAEPLSAWTARAFFIWLSVFNMFAVSVFWSLMADVLTRDEAKALFAPISAGGSIGGIAGSWVTATFVELTGIRNLLLLAAILLLMVAWCAARLLRMHALEPAKVHTTDSTSATRTGGVMAGVTEILGSGYLTRITALAFLYTLIASWLYFIQAHLVNEFISESVARTRFFAHINLAINIIALVLQFFITSSLVRRIGVGSTYGLVLLLVLISIVTLGVWPAVMTIAIAQVAFRSGQFGTMKPCYDMLFSAVTPEQKYKSKNFIDTAITRGGDLTGAFSFTFLKWLGLSISGITGVVVAAGVCLWLIAVNLGKRFDARSS